MVRLLVGFFIVSFFVKGTACAQTASSETSESIQVDVEETVDQLMSFYTENTPGGVVAVIEKGEIIFAKGYGMANLEYGIPNEPDTPYHVASVSKQFTAFAIVMLQQEGKLSLEDEVHKYIPELADFGEKITLRMMLNHTSGLRDQWNLWVLSGGRMDDVIRQEDLFSLIKRQRELNFKPNSEYLYSNTGYLLLAKVVENVTGERFGAWMESNVFKPLEMNATQIYDDHERMVKGRAYSYRFGDGGVRKAVLSYANSGATSLFTTAEDLAKWLRNIHTKEVGGADAWALMQKQGVLVNGDTLDYALGVNVKPHRGMDRIQHGGADAGYRTILSYYPEIDAGVVVLGNISAFNPRRVANGAAEAFWGDQMDAEEANTSSSNNTSESGYTVSPELLNTYTGTYFSPEIETFYTIAVEEGSLVALHRRHGTIKLTPKGKDVFKGNVWFVGDISFERNDNGWVEGMKVSNGRVRNLAFKRQEQ